MNLGVLVIAKNPVPGRVKTRLQPAFSPDESALLAEAALQDVWRTARLSDWAGIAIDPLGAPLPGWLHGEVFPQADGNLGHRITAALTEARRRCPLPLLLVGMDTPQLTAEHLAAGALALEDHAYALGLASDGGFWGLGIARAVPDGLAEVPMSRDDTGVRTLDLLRAQGTVALLQELEDVDDHDSARRVAGIVPGSGFGRTLASLRPKPRP